jgi:hypothetical protein
LLSPPELAHGDKEIGKKRTPEFRRGDRIRHGGGDGYEKGADPARRDGPRYLLKPGKTEQIPFAKTGSSHVATTQIGPNNRN